MDLFCAVVYSYLFVGCQDEPADIVALRCFCVRGTKGREKDARNTGYPSTNVPIFLNLSYLLFVSSSGESFFNPPKESIMAFLRFRAAS